MVWLDCGHERITLTRVYEGRRLPCFNPACREKGRAGMRTITAVGTIDGYSLYDLPDPSNHETRGGGVLLAIARFFGFKHRPDCNCDNCGGVC